MSYFCPNCGGTHTAKYSQVYLGGLEKFEASGSISGRAGGAYLSGTSNLKGHNQSRLSARCAPPREVDFRLVVEYIFLAGAAAGIASAYFPWLDWIIFAIMGVLIAKALIESRILSKLALAVSGLILFGLINNVPEMRDAGYPGWILGIVYFMMTPFILIPPLAVSASRKNRLVIEPALREWHRSWHCYSCGTRFLES